MNHVLPFRLLPSLLALIAAGCTRTAAGDTDPAKVPEVHADVEVVRAGNYAQIFAVTGTVAPAPGASAALSAPIASRVARVYVAEGDRVKIGAPLVAFDPTTLDADVSRAAAALSAARHARDRAERLTEAGVAPRKELEQAMAALADAEAVVSTARRAQSLAVLRAPMAGIVARVSVVRDESVDPTRSVVEVIDPRAVEVVFGIPPRAAALVMPGSLVQLESGVGSDTQSLGSARVVAVGSTVDSVSRNVTVRTKPLDASIALRVGESVVGRLAGASHAGVIAIPVEALIPEGESFHVFVVGADGIAHARKVTVVAQTDKVAHIGGGLRAGERIVTRGAFGVDEGVRIISAAR